jgi:uracil-DNA glycosylase
MHLLNELKQLPRLKLIIALGLQPVQYFVPSLPLAVNAMDSLHGSIHSITWEGLSVDMFITYPPSQALVNPPVNDAFTADMKLLKEYLKHEHLNG